MALYSENSIWETKFVVLLNLHFQWVIKTRMLQPQWPRLNNVYEALDRKIFKTPLRKWTNALPPLDST